MEITSCDIIGLKIIEPTLHYDGRGFFFESFNKEIGDATINAFVQENESFSSKNVLRGLHFQVSPHMQGKLVRVVTGEILDVAVDLREHSSTFGKHHSVVLSGKNKLQFWIPEGFAHGFLSLADDTVVQYKCSSFYQKTSERVLAWNDPMLKIDWGIENPVLSIKDQSARSWNDVVRELTGKNV